MLIGLCWLPVVVLQIRMRDLAEAAVAAGEPALPPRYHALARLWFWLGWPAFLSMLDDFLADDRQARLITPDKREPGHLDGGPGSMPLTLTTYGERP